MKNRWFHLIRWAPVAGAVALVVLIAIISARTMSELKESVFWRRHTVQVLLEAQMSEDSLIDAQRTVHHFALNGNPNLLLEYKNETNAEMREFNRLTEMTRDNPGQQEVLSELDHALKDLFDYDNRVIGVYARQGSDAALKLKGVGTNVIDSAIKDLKRFKEAEKRLLDQRAAKEQLEYHKAARLLVIGSILAAGLLVFANYFVGREMARRRNAEIKQQELIAELQQALADVKTLSGLIPICAWCKNVRSDEGFWHSVEHYLGTHTDAKFSHGMCPRCIEKWSDETETSGAPAQPRT